MRKRGLFPAAAPRRGCRGYNPTHPEAKRAAFAAGRAAPPRRRPPCTRPAGKAAAAPTHAARRIWPRLPLCRRAAPPPGNGLPARLRPPQAWRARRKDAARATRGLAAHPGECPTPQGSDRPAPGCARARPPRAWRVPPRGDQIPGRGLQETAAPSRVNFREIRDPGVTPQKSKNARKNPAKKRKAAAHPDRCLKWLDKLPHHAEVVFFRIEYGQYADDLLRFINAVEDQIILMQDVAKVKAAQNVVFR